MFFSKTMCGIAGAKNPDVLEQIIEQLQHRGNSSNISGNFGHVLHPVVGEVEQPLQKKGKLSANCEIYNWQELNKKYGWETENDAETLLKILDRKGVDALEELDGIYAFAYQNGSEIIIARDMLGISPVWYSEEPFVFASEKQALEKTGLECRELHPRQVLIYNIETKEKHFKQRKFFQIQETEKTIDEFAEEIKEIFLEAVDKRIPDGNVGLLFSGGVDSTMVAAALQKLGKDFTAYTSGIQHGNVNAPKDMEWAEKVAEEMGIKLESTMIKLEDVEHDLPEICDWISSTSTVKNGVALPFHYALNGSEKVVFSGLGSEQLYAGYARHEGYLNKECLSGLRGLFERDLYRDNIISFRNGYEIRLPFLDHDLIEHALTVPAEYKQNENFRKYVLRKAAEKLDVPEDVVWRGKKAAQYGSNFDKAIDRLSKDNGFNHKQEYLNSFREKPNNKIVALTSGGKDSNAALYRVARRNNEISCLLTLRSDNEESYMFDVKKEESVVERQAEQLDIPLIVQETKGEKEKELEDLKAGLKKAKQEYGVEGVVAGALASTYQRDRVEKVAEGLGLKVFAPLWQENQEHYLNWLIREGFEVKITKVATRGLNESWEGRVLDEESVEELIKLSQKYRFNAAGEGGEYETTVINFPDSMLD